MQEPLAQHPQIWFTSDLHLGHKNIAGPEVSNWKEGYRNFKTIGEMDEELLKQLNKCVQQDDTLYFLGDFSFKGNSTLSVYRDRIVCKNIIFIKGNHDKRSSVITAFGHCHDYIEEDIMGIKFCMMHYAMRIWNKSHHGAIHLYGHSHSKLEDNPWGMSMDIGVDNAYRLYGEYRPFSLIDVMHIMDKRESKLIDHHGTAKNKKDELRIN